MVSAARGLQQLQQARAEITVQHVAWSRGMIVRRWAHGGHFVFVFIRIMLQDGRGMGVRVRVRGRVRVRVWLRVRVGGRG